MTRRRGVLALSWSLSWVVMAATWWLLVDTVRTAELVAGAVCAAIAATGSELVRAQRMAPVRVRLAWLARTPRAVAQIPGDLVLLAVAAARQLLRPRLRVGAFRAVPFAAGPDTPESTARHAIAEAFGSLAPNTIVVGIDRRRDLLLVHQLVARRDPDTIDRMGLRR